LSFLLWENVPMNYNRPLVNGRFLVAAWVSLLTLVVANGAFADGAYQRTDDRKKTLVWNNDPQPGDAANWSGGRDSEGYADGPGTLTWLRTERKSLTGSNISSGRKVPISRYAGKMVHGKFEGPVVTVDHGKTFHATYTDGQRKGRWISGDLIAKAESIESKPAAEERPEPSSSAKTAATTEKIESKQPKVAEETTEAPAESPPVESKAEKPAPSKMDTRVAKKETPSGELSADELDQSATPQKPVTKKAVLAPGAVRAIDRPGRQVEKKSEKPKEAPLKIRRATKVEEPKVEQANEQAAEPPAEGPTKSVQVPTPAPSQPRTLNVEPSVPSANETPVDDSIRTLTGPPSSLRTKQPAPPASTPAPPVSAPTIESASPPPSAGPKLNAVQAMDIADIEAREKGYDLGEYQLPKAEYNATDDTWSVSYIARDRDKGGKHLSVIIQDKTGKAEVKK
jgi:hypothetical protein